MNNYCINSTNNLINIEKFDLKLNVIIRNYILELIC